jgi:hypothetical protein
LLRSSNCLCTFCFIVFAENEPRNNAPSTGAGNETRTARGTDDANTGSTGG